MKYKTSEIFYIRKNDCEVYLFYVYTFSRLIYPYLRIYTEPNEY